MLSQFTLKLRVINEEKCQLTHSFPQVNYLFTIKDQPLLIHGYFVPEKEDFFEMVYSLHFMLTTSAVTLSGRYPETHFLCFKSHIHREIRWGYGFVNWQRNMKRFILEAVCMPPQKQTRDSAETQHQVSMWMDLWTCAL